MISYPVTSALLTLGRLLLNKALFTKLFSHRLLDSVAHRILAQLGLKGQEPVATVGLLVSEYYNLGAVS